MKKIFMLLMSGLLLMSLTACDDSSSDTSGSETNADVSYADGVYTGEGEGYVGAIKVEVTIAEGLISNIEVTEESEDRPYFIDSLEILDDMIDEQTYDVDTMTGATVTSKGLKRAVKEALEQAVE